MIRTFIALLGLLALNACSLLPTDTGVPSRSVTLGDGLVTATTPDGYCVDDIASQPTRDFAVLLPCAVLGIGQTRPDVVGFATIQVGPTDSGVIVDDVSALRDYLATDDGVRLLSRNSDESDIEILSSQAFDSQVMIYFADAGPPPLAGLQGDEWRAFTAVNGRLVTIGVRGLDVAPLTEGPGATLLKVVLAGVKAVVIPSEEPTPET